MEGPAGSGAQRFLWEEKGVTSRSRQYSGFSGVSRWQVGGFTHKDL